ncbi:MAG: hypothetical protein LC122_12285 [Chitinophagales bacterium]|nr:hypothetical protein [Chitinophagales bacterium]
MDIYILVKNEFAYSTMFSFWDKSSYYSIIEAFVEREEAENKSMKLTLKKVKDSFKDDKYFKYYRLSSLDQSSIITLKTDFNININDREFLSKKDFDKLPDEQILKLLKFFNIAFYSVKDCKLHSILD